MKIALEKHRPELTDQQVQVAQQAVDLWLSAASGSNQ